MSCLVSLLFCPHPRVPLKLPCPGPRLGGSLSHHPPPSTRLALGVTRTGAPGIFSLNVLGVGVPSCAPAGVPHTPRGRCIQGDHNHCDECSSQCWCQHQQHRHLDSRSNFICENQKADTYQKSRRRRRGLGVGVGIWRAVVGRPPLGSQNQSVLPASGPPSWARDSKVTGMVISED